MKTLLKPSLFCFLFSLIFDPAVFAQVGLLNSVQQPLSPNAAALGKFVEMPVGSFNGTPEINIPLYEFNSNSFTVPVSLSYHASGIKVREIPGWVGAGFLLNAGGAIVRVVRGLPDGMESPGGIDVSNVGYKNAIGLPGNEGLTWLDGRMDKDVSSDVPFNKVDMEFDEFYYNFMGYTGSFMFTNQGTVMMKTASNLKVEFSVDNFKITDAKGMIYEFKQYESQANSPHWYISSWYLTKAINPFKNETIEFKYEPFGLINPYRISNGPVIYYDQVFDFNNSPKTPAGIQNPGCEQQGSDRVMANPLNSDNLFLKQIIHQTDTLKFYIDKTKRTDVYKVRLDSIKVFSRNTMVHKASFNYTYSDTVTTDSLNKKMLLKSVKIDDQKPYYFDYYGSYMSRMMPGIVGEGADMWGYYNGENFPFGQGGHRIFPRYGYKDIPTYSSDRNSSYSNADWRYAQIGSLQKITYPTGGKTEFEYEGHDFISDVFFAGVVFIPDSLRISAAGSFASTPNLKPWTYANEFTIHQDQTATVNTTIGLSAAVIDLTTYRNYLYNSMNPAEQEGKVRLYKFNQVTKVFDLLESRVFNPVTVIGNPATNLAFTLAMPGGTSAESHTRFLTEGRYKLETVINSLGVKALITVNNKFSYRKPGVNNVYNMGGIRIKKIRFTSPVNSSSFEKSYDYNYLGKTSGKLLTPYECVNTWTYVGEYRALTYINGQPYTNIAPQYCRYFKIYHNNTIPLGSGKNGPIGYDHVTEKMNDGRKTVMEFSALADEYVPDEQGLLWKDNAAWRGNLKSVDYYDGNNRKIKREVYTVINTFSNPADAPVTKSAYLTGIQPPGAGQNVSQWWAEIPVRQDNVVPGRDSVLYFNGADTLKEVTKYTYDNKLYPVASKITKINSMGDSTVTYLKYPYDYTISGATSVPFSQGVKLLQTKNVVSQPVETYMSRYTAGVPKVVEAQLVAFKATLPVPDTVYSLNNPSGLTNFIPANFTVSAASKDSRYLRKLLFNKYNNGNVVEQSKDGEPREVLVWGYKRRFIVARVQSSDYNTVISLIDTNVINNPSSDAAMRTELQKIRTGLASTSPKAKVTSYTFSPLIGMTSSTDPGGETVYQEYDSYGRLKRTKDHSGNVKENAWYNYKP